MNKKQKEIISRLQEKHPEVKCALDYTTPLDLTVAVILSAQCTDKRVNMVTPKLFKRCPELQDYIKISQAELEKFIHSTGFYRNKSKSIKGLAKKVQENFKGQIPKKMEQLIQLPGIGRKTANVVQQEVFGKVEGIVVDTHVLRISYRMGFASASKDAVKKEKELMKLLPKKYWHHFAHWMILLGRSVCTAPYPKCSDCFLNDICPKKGVKKQRK